MASVEKHYDRKKQNQTLALYRIKPFGESWETPKSIGSEFKFKIAPILKKPEKEKLRRADVSSHSTVSICASIKGGAKVET